MLRARLACLMTMFLLAAPAAAVGRPEMDYSERAVVRELNALRSGRGLSRLRADRHLARAAAAHSRDMVRAGFFAHASSNGRSANDRVQSYRRSSLTGEALAYMPLEGDSSPQKIVEAWMASTPHARTLLGGRFRRIGVSSRRGMLFGTPMTVWTADLASAR